MEACANADVTGSECPSGNGAVNLFDMLSLLDAVGADMGGTLPAVGFGCDCPSNP